MASNIFEQTAENVAGIFPDKGQWFQQNILGNPDIGSALLSMVIPALSGGDLGMQSAANALMALFVNQLPNMEQTQQQADLAGQTATDWNAQAQALLDALQPQIDQQNQYSQQVGDLALNRAQQGPGAFYDQLQGSAAKLMQEPAVPAHVTQQIYQQARDQTMSDVSGANKMAQESAARRGTPGSAAEDQRRLSEDAILGLQGTQRQLGIDRTLANRAGQETATQLGGQIFGMGEQAKQGQLGQAMGYNVGQQNYLNNLGRTGQGIGGLGLGYAGLGLDYDQWQQQQGLNWLDRLFQYIQLEENARQAHRDRVSDSQIDPLQAAQLAMSPVAKNSPLDSASGFLGGLFG